jgi:hypothetical protein
MYGNVKYIIYIMHSTRCPLFQIYFSFIFYKDFMFFFIFYDPTEAGPRHCACLMVATHLGTDRVEGPDSNPRLLHSSQVRYHGATLLCLATYLVTIGKRTLNMGHHRTTGGGFLFGFYYT